MQLIDILIIVITALIVSLVIYHLISKKKKGESLRMWRLSRL